MKKLIKILLLFAAMFIGCIACNEIANVDTDSQPDTLRIPESKYLSDEQLQDQIEKEIRGIQETESDVSLPEALKVIDLTQQAINHIKDSSYTEAVNSLEEAIGMTVVLTTSNPELSFFPLDVQITERDLVADIDVLKEIKNEVKKLTDKGYLQEARHLLNNMASELEIKTTMLPIATYPDALALAAKAMNENNEEEALSILVTALNTVFIENRYIPLPLIRAERMMEEIDKLLEEPNKDKEISTLLDNAEYQIKFAETLGYGKKDKEFEEMYTQIKEIRKGINAEEKENSKNLIDNLHKKLSAFKERITNESKSDGQVD